VRIGNGIGMENWGTMGKTMRTEMGWLIFLLWAKNIHTAHRNWIVKSPPGLSAKNSLTNLINTHRMIKHGKYKSSYDIAYAILNEDLTLSTTLFTTTHISGRNWMCGDQLSLAAYVCNSVIAWLKSLFEILLSLMEWRAGKGKLIWFWRGGLPKHNLPCAMRCDAFYALKTY